MYNTFFIISTEGWRNASHPQVNSVLTKELRIAPQHFSAHGRCRSISSFEVQPGFIITFKQWLSLLIAVLVYKMLDSTGISPGRWLRGGTSMIITLSR